MLYYLVLVFKRLGRELVGYIATCQKNDVNNLWW